MGRWFVISELTSICRCLPIRSCIALLHVSLLIADIHHFLRRSFFALRWSLLVYFFRWLVPDNDLGGFGYEFPVWSFGGLVHKFGFVVSHS